MGVDRTTKAEERMREGERREENDKYMRHMLRMECKGKCEFVDCEYVCM